MVQLCTKSYLNVSFCGVVLSGFRTLPRTMSLALSFDLGRARDSTFSIHDFAFVKSASSSTFNLYKRFWAGSTTRRSSWHFHSSHSCRTSQRIRELFRFICGQLHLRCQVTLALNEEVVDTVGNMLENLTHPNLHMLWNDSLSVTSWTTVTSCALFRLSVCAGILN